jgi:hypothetical protein
MVAMRGAAMAPLEAPSTELHLAAHEPDADVAGLDRQRVTMASLVPADSLWKPAADATTNYVATSITALGLYADSLP